MKKKDKKKLTKLEIAKGSVVILLFLAFVVYAQSWWFLLALPFIFDAYFTRKINWYWWKEAENPNTRLVMSWLDAIVFALVAVYFVNIYFFQNYTIPSSSLEKSLLVGDYLAVSKMSYGARVPQTPLHMPLCQHTLPFGWGKSYIGGVQFDYKRIHAKQVPLNDIVVFNYPAGDSILTPEPLQTRYYEMCYAQGWNAYFHQYGKLPDLSAMSPMEQRRTFDQVYNMGRVVLTSDEATYGKIGYRPVDRRENYVKRCVGTPGQTLEIRDRIIYLDGKANKEPDNVQYCHLVKFAEGKRYDFQTGRMEELCHELGISNEDVASLYQLENDANTGQLLNPGLLEQYDGYMPLTHKAAEELKARQIITDYQILSDKELFQMPSSLYPQNGSYGWTRDNYGPLWIPAKGKQIPGGLTLENLPVYERLIKAYEGNSLEVTPDGKILINGKEARNYTFKMDYYWMMGDNRHCSADSRSWGFVPEDHVVGKPTLIWLSLDPDRSLFQGGIRWQRLFRWVDNIK